VKLLLHLVGCLYYLYQRCAVKQISENEIHLLIKYIKSVLWRVVKRLSYIQDARCLKFNESEQLTEPASQVYQLILENTRPSCTLHLQVTFFVKRQKNTARNKRTYCSYTRFDPVTFKQEKIYLNLASWSLIFEVN